MPNHVEVEGTLKAWFEVGELNNICFQITDEGIIVDLFDEKGDIVNTFAATPDEFAFDPMFSQKEGGKVDVRTPVWVLNINSRYGHTVSTHNTEESANNFLKKWADDMWYLSGDMPYNTDDSIKEYFDFFSGESFTLNYTEMIY